MVWAVSHFHAYLYGHVVAVYTDHSAVTAVLGTPSPNDKHAQQWTRVFGSGIQNIDIVYQPGREDKVADSLSRNPQMGVQDGEADKLQVATVRAMSMDIASITQLLQGVSPNTKPSPPCDFGDDQRKDEYIKEFIDSVEAGDLLVDSEQAKKIAAIGSLCTMEHGILYFVDPKHYDQKRAVVPVHLRDQIMWENHSGQMSGHFSGNWLYSVLTRHW